MLSFRGTARWCVVVDLQVLFADTDVGRADVQATPSPGRQPCQCLGLPCFFSYALVQIFTTQYIQFIGIFLPPDPGAAFFTRCTCYRLLYAGTGTPFLPVHIGTWYQYSQQVIEFAL